MHRASHPLHFARQHDRFVVCRKIAHLSVSSLLHARLLGFVRDGALDGAEAWRNKGHLLVVTTAALSIMEGKDVYGNDVDPAQVHGHFLFPSAATPRYYAWSTQY